MKSIEDEVTHRFAHAEGERKVAPEPLAKLYQRSLSLLPEEYQQEPERLTKLATDCARDDKPLDAMLHFVELTLVTGGGLPDAFAEFKELLSAATEVRLLQAALNESQESEEKAKEALEGFEVLLEHATSGLHVVKILKANVHTSLGDDAIARTLLIEGLESNPYILGAWRDLGNHFGSDYWEQDYYLCWDLVRRLDRGNPALEEIDARERQQRDENPEYFRA